MVDEELTRHRTGTALVLSTRSMPPEEALRIARAPGDRLSISPKYRVDRVGEWVVKIARFAGGLGMLRLTFAPGRRRSAMNAAQYLSRHGVAVPEFGAQIEWGFAGIVWQTAVLTRYFDGAVSIRDHALSLRDAPRAEVDAFLSALASAVNRLAAAGAYHPDLKGRNILTQDGRRFCFIDLDSARVGAGPDAPERMRNVVQLLDAFYDLWPMDQLREFAVLLAPQEQTDADWIKHVFARLDDRIRDRHAFHQSALQRMEEIFGKLEDSSQ